MWRKALFAAVLLLITSSLVALPAAAQSPTWRADYFNNGGLNGPAAFTRNDANIAFNWGTGSPGSGVDADDFSVRWATDVSLSPGTYRFYAQADDNVRIIFNYVTYAPVIDTFASGQVNQLVTGDVNVTSAGTYHIQVDYREVTDQAFAYVSFTNMNTNPTGPNFPAPQQPVPVPTGSWTAQYFGNNSLSGDPVAILTESTPTHAWGSAAPFVSLPADNFSARWTSLQNLIGGTYNVSVAADDGVRVMVNGSLVVNEWHPASGQTYNVSLNLPPGQNYFQVEYYEGTGDAFITFNLTQTGGTGVVPTQQPSPTGATATVTAYRLNVRVSPDASSQIVTRINRLEVYPIVGRTANSLWYLINVGGTQGWVSAGYINVAPVGANIPVVGASASPTTPPTTTGNVVTANPYNVVIRSGPGTQYRRLGLLPVGGTAPIVGRTAVNSWWQINFNGLVGWVSSQYAQIGSGANIEAIPVTG